MSNIRSCNSGCERRPSRNLRRERSGSRAKARLRNHLILPLARPVEAWAPRRAGPECATPRPHPYPSPRWAPDGLSAPEEFEQVSRKGTFGKRQAEPGAGDVCDVSLRGVSLGPTEGP